MIREYAVVALGGSELFFGVQGDCNNALELVCEELDIRFDDLKLSLDGVVARKKELEHVLLLLILRNARGADAAEAFASQGRSLFDLADVRSSGLHDEGGIQPCTAEGVWEPVS